MKLYKFDWSPAPRRVLFYLREKGAEGIEMIDVNLATRENRSPEFLRINPAGTVPVLETDEGHFIRQSTSIIEYLDERLPGPPMMGASPEAVAHTRDLLRLLEQAYAFKLTCALYASPLLKERRTPSHDVARAMLAEADRSFDVLEDMVGDGHYFGGDHPSVADILFFTTEEFLRTVYRLPLPASCEKMEAVYQRYAGRASVLPLDVPAFVAELAPVPDLSPTLNQASPT